MKALNNILFVNFVSKALYSYLIKYPTPMNINYLWNFGFMSAIFLVIQIISGLFLTFFFTPHVDLAFFSVEHIMRDVNYGWLIRYVHANGASFFFFLVYIHILKGIYYGSYYFPRTLVWFTGCIIYILMMGTAFLGYVLPWGQMSYWAATVITNLVTVIPVVGKDIVYWIWGGFSINNATLNRFFSLHYLLPFVIAVLSAYHIYQLHKSGSSNELGIRSHYLNKISFYPYFLVKDFFGLFIILFFFFIFVFFYPEAFNHADNYVKANPLVTPAHIVPEWYVLPLYGILRSILNKTYGIIIMFVSLLVLFILPFIDKSLVKNKTFKPFNRSLFWIFAFNFLFLGYLGSQAPIYPYIELGLICSHFHLLYFFLLIPLSVFFESSFLFSYFSSNKSINTSSTKSNSNKSQNPTKFELHFLNLITSIAIAMAGVSPIFFNNVSLEICGIRDLLILDVVSNPSLYGDITYEQVINAANSLKDPFNTLKYFLLFFFSNINSYILILYLFSINYFFDIMCIYNLHLSKKNYYYGIVVTVFFATLFCFASYFWLLIF